MKPLLAHIYSPRRVTYPCYVQPKLNGIRALYQNGRFQSRDQLPFPEPLLRHLSSPLKAIFPPDVILDGELYKHGWPLQRINGAVTPVRGMPNEDTLQVEYHVFDIAKMSDSFELRFHFNDFHLPNTGIKRVPTCVTLSEASANNVYAAMVKDGYEGMMYRLEDCPYTLPKQPNDCGTKFGRRVRLRFLSDKDNRTWHLLKRKDWRDDEFPFVSINETRGELGEPGFQLALRAGGGKLFKVGSGLTASQVAHYLQHPPHDRTIKVKYLVLSMDGIPLNATVHPDHIL